MINWKVSIATVAVFVVVAGAAVYILDRPKGEGEIAYSVEERILDEVESLRDQMQWYTLDIGQTHDIEGPIHFYSLSNFRYILPSSTGARIILYDENGGKIESIIAQDTNWVRTVENYRSGQYLSEIISVSVGGLSDGIPLFGQSQRQFGTPQSQSNGGFIMPQSTIPGMDRFVVNLDDLDTFDPIIGLDGQCMVIETVEET